MKQFLLAAAAIAFVSTSAQAQIAKTPGVAEKLEALGKNLSPKMIGGTFKIYGPMHAKASMDGVKVTKDQVYGPHERNKLDVYAPANANGTQPVLVFVHGGGFVRGDKKAQGNIGRYFAQQGIVAIPINYRFAPASKWPSGGQDVAKVVKWIKDNAAVHGGNPKKIVLSGNSAGAMHVADYTFHENLQMKDDGVIGSIIISPPTADLTSRPVDPKRDALYYGTDGDRKAQSVAFAVDGRKIPVLIAYAENEPDVIIDQTFRLIAAIAKRDKRMPLVSAAPGHNHISIVAHIGTADETMGSAMVGAITRWAQ